MNRLLLHICCAPCSTHVFKILTGEYNVSGFFYNPNIYPLEEYNLRIDAARSLSKEFQFDLIEGEIDEELWNKKVSGLESEPEGGKRCEVCFRFRLDKTAAFASQNGFDVFASTLTISPHKNADAINKIGEDVSRKYEIEFLVRDFKKRNGFANSLKLSKEHNLYRQKYCGCRYSRKQS